MRRASSRPKALLRLVAMIVGMAAFAAIAPSPAAAWERVETYGFPSTQGNIDLSQNTLNGGETALTVHVALPQGYDEQPDKKWPVIYLLHGIDDNSTTWLYALQTLGDIPAVLVMPEGGRGFWTDQWINGTRKGSNWERYFLQEVLPVVNRYFRILPGRSDHAIIGNSMGGQGAIILGAELPGYFGTAASFSGLLSITDPFAMFVFPGLANISYTRYWGPYLGPYAITHSADRQMQNLKDTNVLLTSGNGTASPKYPVGISDKAVGGALEVGALADLQAAFSAGRSAGVPITARIRAGIHAWEYWRDDLDYAVNTWGLFRADPIPDDQQNTNWKYRTMATTGNAWGIGYAFKTPPTNQLFLTRVGQTLTAAGGGSAVTISPGAAQDDASGAGTRPDCTFTATPPFTKVLPAGC
ncbi:MAG: alpha/beta hydrolase-fold protein [Solirubrobacteraceae bacterium]